MKKTMMILALLAAAGVGMFPAAAPAPEAVCEMKGTPGAGSKGLGPADFNAAYHGFVAAVEPGGRAVIRAPFPHARYLSIIVYDEELHAADALLDSGLVPSRGTNPFVAGADRQAADLGEFEVTVLMDDPPAGERPPNTLYAGRTYDGQKNGAMLLAYRIYLPDEKFSFAGNRPGALTGGVAAPAFTLYDADGKASCPNGLLSRVRMMLMVGASLYGNRDKYLDPENYYGPPENPPAWFNEYSRGERRGNKVVGNEDTIYITAPVSDEFGELLALRWRPPRTPVATYMGEPFESGVDMRYFSLSFAYRDKSDYSMILTERTVPDVEVPILPDGTGQLVVGFGGMERPAAVPEEQWVGLQMKRGFIIMRNIVVSPDYAGDPGRLPAGRIAGDADRYTPGGIYCTAAEFALDPDLGLRRAGGR